MKPRFSLRTKFVLIALGNLALLALLLLLFVRFQLEQEFESFLMATAREKIIAVAQRLTLDLQDTSDRAQRDALLDRYSREYGVRFRLYMGGGELFAGTPAPLPHEVAERMRRPRNVLRRPGFPIGPPPFLISSSDSRYWVGIPIAIRSSGAERTMPRGSLLIESSSLWSNPFFFDLEPWLAILAIALLVSLLCWFPLVRGLTHDISEMTHATAAVAEGQFDIRIKSGRTDELGSLGGSINQMAERLKTYVQGQKRFLGDVAHELRSPLGRMQVALSILERKASQEEQEYLRDVQEDVELMSGLTTELLTFARAGIKPGSVDLSPLNLRSIAERAAAVEDGDEPRIVIDIPPDLTVLANEEYLFRAISNLVRNSLRYAGESGAIGVAAVHSDGRVTLTVADEGPGVPEDALEKIFDPFYRLEASRDRSKGGTGLGLAIVRSCVEACGGSVHARNRQPHGLEVIINLQAPPS